jgi:small subunit ribosomal protein S17
MGKRKTYIGLVTSDKMQKTVVVSVTTMKKHAKYGKVLKQHNKFKAHHEGTAKFGDTVEIEETKPISKDKRFRVVKVIKKAAIPHVELKEEIQ